MKRILILLFVVFTLAAALFGCEERKETEYVGIISAMENEMNALVAETELERVDTVGGEKYYVGKLRGQSVVITKAGIGKVRASSGVTTLLNTYKVGKVIFTGIAGGVAEEAEVLDEVIATRVVEHDYGILTNDGFVWSSGDPGMGIQPGEYYYCDEDLVDLAYAAATEVMGEEAVHKGTIASGDQFIASEEYVNKLRRDYDAYACEMEGASVGIVCIKYGVPFVVIRALSDKADGNAHDSYENFGDVAAEHSANIVKKMLSMM